MSKIVGIDLGTTYSAIAVVDEYGQPRIVHNKDGQNTTASCVAIQDGTVEVGSYAQKIWGENQSLAAARFKRSMGTGETFKVNGQVFSPTELSSLVLKKIVKDAESEIGPIAEAVVTIPANFAHEAREATMAAAKAAGLEIKYIINEPTAAALYYAFKNGKELNGAYAVYDLGGGTFDITVIRAKGHEIEVLRTGGIAKLGGHDFDIALRKLFKNKLIAVGGTEEELSELSNNDFEIEKKNLSNRASTKVRIGKHQIEVSRAEFEEAISTFLVQTEMLCESTLEEAHLRPEEIQSVFLVGGSTRVPAVRESVKKVFKKEPVATINVDEVVALGAALYAAYKTERTKLTPEQKTSVEKIQVSESTSKYFGTLSINHNQQTNQQRVTNSILIKKGERIPCSISERFLTIHDNQDTVRCSVTESTSPETDPKFVKVIWEGLLSLPPGRPKNQEIEVAFSYDSNQIMKCSFRDVSTGKTSNVDLSMAAATNIDESKLKKFLVE